MSYEVSTAEVQQYKSNVWHLSQQKGSHFRPAVRTVPDVVGLNYYFERIGATAMQVKQSRHSDTPLISTPHSRRRVSMVTYNWGDLVDNDDKLKVLINPESEYVVAAKMAFGRGIDDIIVNAALGTSYSGADGATSVTFPTAQVVADTAITNLTSLDAGSDDGQYFSAQRLLAVKKLFDTNDVDPSEEKYIAVDPLQISKAMGKVSISSADYNTMRVLAEGGIDTYMNFKFFMSNRLPTSGLAGSGTPDGLGNYYSTLSGETAADRLNFAWAKSGIGLAVQEDIKVEIGKRPDKNFSTQLYVEMVMGGTRVEEAKVVRMPTKST